MDDAANRKRVKSGVWVEFNDEVEFEEGKKKEGVRIDVDDSSSAWRRRVAPDRPR